MAKNLQTNIIIGGKTTSGFDALGNKLLSLGAIVEQIGGWALDFEKESVEVYKNYETLMLEAEGALTTQYKSATQRAKVMEDLEKHVAQWAANSIFHTDDYAKAVSEAAHAGWQWQEMLEGIPVAANLAQAGNITLSEGLDDLIKTLNATGEGTENAGKLVDQWTMAANSSATTVAELGEALKKMGSTARFADSTEELFAMLGVLADTGTVGESAGTMLRNAMLRIVAPTTKAEDAMNLLGADVEELEDVLKDKSVTKAAKELEGLGFSAYNANGDLKPMIQIFGELDDALSGLDEAARNEIIAAIFPTRTTAAALAFLEATNGQFDELMEALKNSEGYAERVAKIQTSGLMGATERLNSKVEELKRKVGGLLSDNLEDVYNFLGRIVDFTNNLSEPALGALTGAMTALAGAGPSLIGLGIASKAMAALAAHPVVAGLLGAAVAIGAIAGYAEEVSRINWAENFGDLVVDTEALSQYVEGIQTRYDEEIAKVNEWKNALEVAQATYSGLATTLSEELMFDTLTGKKLTKKEQDALTEYGDSIGKALSESIQQAWTRDFEWADILFPEGESAEGDAERNFILDLTDSRYESLLANAEALSQQLKDALSSALEDGIITEEERNNIVNEALQAMNEIQAKIASRLDRQEYYRELARAQRVSYDSMADFMTELSASRAEKKKKHDEDAAAQYGQMMDDFDAAIESGGLFDVEGNGVKRRVTEADRKRVEDLYWARQDALWQEQEEFYGGFAQTAIQSLMHDSGFADVWDLVSGGAQKDEYGNWDFSGIDASGMSDEDLRKTAELGRRYQDFTRLMKSFAGFGPVGDSISLLKALYDYADIAQAELDYRKNTVTAAGEFAEYPVEPTQFQLEAKPSTVDEYNEPESLLDQEPTFTPPAELETWDGEKPTEAESRLTIGQYTGDAQEELDSLLVPQISIDGDEVQSELNALEVPEVGTDAGAVQEELDNIEPVEVEFTTSGAQQELDSMGPRLKAPQEGGAPADFQLREQGVTVEVAGDTAMLDATIAAEDGQTLMAYVNGNTDELHAEIYEEDGQTILAYVDGNADAIGRAIQQYEGHTIHVNIIGNRMFAEGGRATEPSIFGEVPGQAEWAIPEAHTERTADLLSAAAKASGFTWNELLARNGGLNADPNHVSVNVNYAPTINAGDAAGVADALAQDKARLEKIVRDAIKAALEEQRFMDEIAVYA